MPDTNYELSSSGVGGGGFGGFGGGFGGGIGGFGLFGLIGLLGGRRGLGLGGDDCDDSRRGGDGCRDAIWQASIGSKLGTIEAAIPMSTAALEAAITASNTAIRDGQQTQNLLNQQSFSQLALAGANQFSSLKDSVQFSTVATGQGITNLKDTVQLGIAAQAAGTNELANLINSNTCAIKQTVMAEGALTRSLIDQRYIDSVKDELNELRHEHRARGSEINITNTLQNTSVQMQQQQQQQQQQQAIWDLHNKFNCFLGHFNQFQAQRATAGAVQFGTGNIAAQTPTNTANQVGGF